MFESLTQADHGWWIAALASAQFHNREPDRQQVVHNQAQSILPSQTSARGHGSTLLRVDEYIIIYWAMGLYDPIDPANIHDYQLWVVTSQWTKTRQWRSLWTSRGAKVSQEVDRQVSQPKPCCPLLGPTTHLGHLWVSFRPNLRQSLDSFNESVDFGFESRKNLSADLQQILIEASGEWPEPDQAGNQTELMPRNPEAKQKKGGHLPWLSAVANCSLILEENKSWCHIFPSLPARTWTEAASVTVPIIVPESFDSQESARAVVPCRLQETHYFDQRSN